MDRAKVNGPARKSWPKQWGQAGGRKGGAGAREVARGKGKREQQRGKGGEVIKCFREV